MLGQVFTYDNVNEVTSFQEGTISGGTIGSRPPRNRGITIRWGTGPSVTTNSSTQTRKANAENEYTSVSGATTPTYDANGNMTTDSAGLQYVYNAWNQVVTVKNSSGTTLGTYAYDGLGRRIEVTNSLDQHNDEFVLLFKFAGTGRILQRRFYKSLRLEPGLRQCADSARPMVEVGPTLRLFALQDANWTWWR